MTITAIYTWTVVAVTVVVMWAGDARADARKRIVVLPFDGLPAAALHADAVKLLKTSQTVIRTEQWLGAARRMNARKLTRRNIQKIATKLHVDGIISGTLGKRGRDDILQLELRDGSSGELVSTRVTIAGVHPLDTVARGHLRDALLQLIDKLGADRGGPNADNDSTDPENTSDAVLVTDDDDLTAAASSQGSVSTIPVRVAVECESQDEPRTKACPVFLLGFVDAHNILLSSPRASADVILYASTVAIALVDHVHLRFVGKVPGAPPIVETDVDLDTRADDDSQRSQLEPGFLRGIALFVAARHPDLIAVALGSTDTNTVVTSDTSPWDVKLEIGGYGNWSDQYQSYNGTSDLGVMRLAPTSRVGISLHANGGINRQPSLVLPGGTPVSVNTNQWRIGGNLNAAWLLDDHWSFGSTAAVSRDDPDGQYNYTLAANAGVEWDKYQANDPRGNRLAILYAAGYQVDSYNLQNVLGEKFARYPIHQLIASGTVREDKVGVGIALSIGAALLEPMRRNHVSASPFVEWKLGEHIDLNISFSIARRELPAPDPSQINSMDYALLSRLSYAQSLTINGSLSLSIHLDRTNGARNDRFTDL